MTPAVAVRLGRISNLPTVWTNTLAGAVLAGAATVDWRLLILVLAMSLAYVGGMFLNDAFDRHIDAVQRPERPIPSGEVSVRAVFVAGFAMLSATVVLVTCSAVSYGVQAASAGAYALGLCAAIVVYDLWHKSNPLSPLLMGLCRVLVYLSVARAVVDEPAADVYGGALILLGWLIGLTYTAKQEHLGAVGNAWPLLPLAAPLVFGIRAAIDTPVVWLPTLLLAVLLISALRRLHRREPGDVPRAVTGMIAGIACVDALLIASIASPALTVLALLACPLTLALQRVVPGT